MVTKMVILFFSACSELTLIIKGLLQSTAEIHYTMTKDNWFVHFPFKFQCIWNLFDFLVQPFTQYSIMVLLQQFDNLLVQQYSALWSEGLSVDLSIFLPFFGSKIWQIHSLLRGLSVIWLKCVLLWSEPRKALRNYYFFFSIHLALLCDLRLSGEKNTQFANVISVICSKYCQNWKFSIVYPYTTL